MRMTRQISEFGPSAGLSIITSQVQVHGFDHTGVRCPRVLHRVLHRVLLLHRVLHRVAPAHRLLDHYYR